MGANDVASPNELRVLIADPNPRSAAAIEAVCRSNGYQIIARPGDGAPMNAVASSISPVIAFVDSSLAEEGGPFSLERLRQASKSEINPYVILIAPHASPGGLAADLPPEADDCVARPVDPRELRARLRVAHRLLRLETALTERVLELENALGRVKNLQGLLPMCSYCKRIRNGRNYWQQVESYIAEHSNAEFTHGVCPHCYETIVKREMERLRMH